MAAMTFEAERMTVPEVHLIPEEFAMWQAIMVLWAWCPLPFDGTVLLPKPKVAASYDWWQRCEEAWQEASRQFMSGLVQVNDQSRRHRSRTTVADILEMLEEQDKTIIAMRGFFDLGDELQPWTIKDLVSPIGEQTVPISFWRTVFQRVEFQRIIGSEAKPTLAPPYRQP